MEIPTVACTKCLKVLPEDLVHFAPKPQKTNGLESWCRECRRVYAREAMRRRRADPVEREKILAAKLKHARSKKGRERKRLLSQIDNHKRRQRHLPNAQWRWSLADWEWTKLAWENKCAYCGKSGVPLEHDHFIPLSSSDCPGTTPRNIVPACVPCSRSKGKKMPKVWLADRQEVLMRILYYFERLKPFVPLPKPYLEQIR